MSGNETQAEKMNPGNEIPPLKFTARATATRANPWVIFAGLGAIAGLLSLALAWVSNHFNSAQGWASFFAVALLSVVIVALVWRLLGAERLPRWLMALLAAAILLRLGAGVLWYVALPVWGHGTPAEKAGYIMADANARDRQAWKLAQSARPLWSAFSDNRKVDQYGGLLFMSAAIYRYSGAERHQPLLLLVLFAAVSSLAVFFIYAVAQRAFDSKVAALAAWLMALYPEAVLLGSSQMREAFTITLALAAFYGLLRYQQERLRSPGQPGSTSARVSLGGWAWILAPLGLFLPFSPPFAAFLLGLIVLTALLMAWPLDEKIQKEGSKGGERVISRWHSYTPAIASWRFWLIVIIVSLVILAGLWLVLRQFTPEKITNPVEMLSWWLRKSASFQAYLSKNASGWMQKIFKVTPEWSHLPMLLAYGVAQPFLPAALVVGSQAPIWPWITLVRAVAWNVLLLLLINALLLAARLKNRAAIAFSVVVWLTVFSASFRGGADLWDNPRYRAVFAGLQIIVAAWALVEGRRQHDPWLRRIALAGLSLLVWFIPWYLRRYYAFNWPINDFFQLIGLGCITAFLVIGWDIWFTRRKAQSKQT